MVVVDRREVSVGGVRTGVVGYSCCGWFLPVTASSPNKR